MLYRGSKIIIICIVLLLSSCKKEPTQAEIQQQRQEEMQEALKKRALYIDFSKKLIGEKEYNRVYHNAKDSIANWIKNKLGYTAMFENGFILDSLICFNHQKNKCVMALSHNNLPIDGCDGMEYFFGIKIKKQWYFFRGASIHLPRNYYQDDDTKPLSLALLNQIAIEEVFSGYLKQEKFSNKYDINENLFSDITSRAWCTDCKTPKDYDEFFLNHIKKNWLITYKPLKKEEIHYNYDRSNKKLRISFPIHLPNLRDSPLRGIAIRYWEKLPQKEEEKQINRLTLMEEFDSRESRDKGLCEEGEYKNDYVMVDAKGKPIKMYSKLITGIEPNKQYTMKITFDYPDGWAFFVTDFSTSKERGKK